MPRQSKASRMKEILEGQRITRTVGLEIEGYMKDYPEGVRIRHAQIKHDGSLHNAWWHDRNRPFGVEIATDPLHSLTQIDEVFEDIKTHRWGTGRGSAGLHIHVDVSDFNLKDKVRAVYFGKRIEDVMLLFVKPGRYDSRYSHLLSNDWTRLIDSIPLDESIWSVFNNIRNAFNHYNTQQRVSNPRSYDGLNIATGRYNWLNVFSTHYPTIEFRLFHAIKDEIEGKQFAVLAHNFIETIKYSTIEQLKFIADSIDAQPDIKTKGEMLLSAINVPFVLPIVGKKAFKTLKDREDYKASQAQRAVSASAV